MMFLLKYFFNFLCFFCLVSSGQNNEKDKEINKLKNQIEDITFQLEETRKTLIFTTLKSCTEDSGQWQNFKILTKIFRIFLGEVN